MQQVTCKQFSAGFFNGFTVTYIISFLPRHLLSAGLKTRRSKVKWAKNGAAISPFHRPMVPSGRFVIDWRLVAPTTGWRGLGNDDVSVAMKRDERNSFPTDLNSPYLRKLSSRWSPLTVSAYLKSEWFYKCNNIAGRPNEILPTLSIHMYSSTSFPLSLYQVVIGPHLNILPSSFVRFSSSFFI